METKEKEIKCNWILERKLKKAEKNGFSKEHLSQMLELLEFEFPVKFTKNMCQGFKMQIEQGENLQILISNRNESNITRYLKTPKEDNFYFVKGKNEKINITKENEKTTLYFEFKDISVEVQLEKELPTISTSQIILERMKQYSGNGNVEDIALFFQKLLETKQMRIIVSKNNGEEETVSYENGELVSVYKKVFEENKCKEIYYNKEKLDIEYSIYYEGEFMFNIADIRIESDCLDFLVSKDLITFKWYQALKNFPRNSIQDLNFDKEDELISGIIKKQRYSNKLKEIIACEEEEALQFFNSKKISL